MDGIHDIPAIENRPFLYPDLFDDWNIFWRLSGKRRVDGMSGYVGQIPYSEIEAYMRIHDIDTGRERLLDRIEFMDRIFCNFHNREKK